MSRPAFALLASPMAALLIAGVGAATMLFLPRPESLILGGPCLLTGLVLLLRHQRVVEPRNLQALSELEREIQALRLQHKREDQLNRGILSHLREGVVLLGPDRQIRLFNPAAQLLLSTSSRLTLEGSLMGLFREPESLRHVDRAYAGEVSEWVLRRDPRVLRLRALPFAFIGEGEGLLLTLDDITHQEALETTRQKFISNASHELKTPVTGIRIAAENLLDGAQVLEAGLGNLKAILRAVDRMVLLIDDVSELSRIESGALRLEPEEVDVAAFSAQVLEDLESQALARSIALELRLDPRLAGTRLQADPLRLNQLLANLLSNAVKFSPEGAAVTLEVEASPEAVTWRVRDRGPGIPESDLKRIFERFYRAPATRGIPGTGLGLAIVKHLAHVMGGEVGVESGLGEGTTFTLNLPR